MSDEYTDSDFRNELTSFVESRLFGQIETRLMTEYKQQLADIPASEIDRLVEQKRKIEALNDLIGTMRHYRNETTLEELNDH